MALVDTFIDNREGEEKYGRLTPDQARRQVAERLKKSHKDIEAILDSPVGRVGESARRELSSAIDQAYESERKDRLDFYSDFWRNLEDASSDESGNTNFIPWTVRAASLGFYHVPAAVYRTVRKSLRSGNVLKGAVAGVGELYRGLAKIFSGSRDYWEDRHREELVELAAERFVKYHLPDLKAEEQRLMGLRSDQRRDQSSKARSSRARLAG